ncbi:MAG TPA: LLM class flavin-dependent oxidoreductase [Pseudonocardiaceae bacterium]|jgi:alkanesulfonate monooxygenase SsuD/methylene tetrahydromethanopterin reductase-like flavin-dependent oxidoreductase (luciferase family)|nr:LLM class flavin-dependent oxidoreductase [Pseudonocardiaceae bacterium]
MPEKPLHLAVALDGAGWHPAAWREPDADPAGLFGAAYWLRLVSEAQRGRLDFVTFEDSLGMQSTRSDGPDERTDQVRGRLDAHLIAARVAPLTSNIGLVPVVTVTHTEPFHTSKAIASLDYVSTGRAGWQVRVSPRDYEAKQFGRREIPGRAELFDEAADYVEVVRRLWDSWEDDAIIRDVASGRFVDTARLHYIGFSGKWFSVKGPSITPRPPQGQPLVTLLAHGTVPYRLGARAADLIYVTPRDADQATAIVGEIGAEGSDRGPLHVFGDVVVFLDETEHAARARRSRLDDLAGAEYLSDARIFAGTPTQLADLLVEWQAAGLTGFRLRPAALPHDLTAIVDGLVPELRARGLFRREYEASTLRGLLGLSRPANRYATA